MKKFAIAAAVLFGAAGMAQAQVAGDAGAGQQKAATCAACHGTDGNSTNPIWPKLAGQHADYIVKQLQAFKSGDRTDPTMNGMAAPLSEQDMADLGAYFSSQTRSIESADAEQAAFGEKIYRGGIMEKGVAACMACHGPAGDGNAPANFPSLKGQQKAYVVKALEDFRTGKRTTDPNGMMRGVAQNMSQSDMEAVAEYISGLH